MSKMLKNRDKTKKILKKNQNSFKRDKNVKNVE